MCCSASRCKKHTGISRTAAAAGIGVLTRRTVAVCVSWCARQRLLSSAAAAASTYIALFTNPHLLQRGQLGSLLGTFRHLQGATRKTEQVSSTNSQSSACMPHAVSCLLNPLHNTPLPAGQASRSASESGRRASDVAAKQQQHHDEINRCSPGIRHHSKACTV